MLLKLLRTTGKSDESVRGGGNDDEVGRWGQLMLYEAREDKLKGAISHSLPLPQSKQLYFGFSLGSSAKTGL